MSTPSARALALALVLAASPALAQAPGEPPPAAAFEERLEVSEVLLDVLVTDARGNVVIGLGPADFVVKEEGKPVALTGAAFYSNRRFAGSPELASRLGVEREVVPADRTFVLFFQDHRAADPSLARYYLDAVRWTQRWLGELAANDRVAVVSYGASLEIWQDFTADKAAGAAAAAAIFTGRRKPLANWPSRLAGEPGAGPSLLAGLPQGRALRRASRRVYDGITLVGEAMAPITGRKNLILFSLGFGETREFGLWTPDPRYYPAMVEVLNDRNVAVYTIDLISTGQQGSLQDRGNNQALSQLAADTGGRYAFWFTDFLQPLREVAEENNGYYLLSYRAAHPAGSSGYRAVEVATVNPDFHIKARQGYRYGEEKGGG